MTIILFYANFVNGLFDFCENRFSGDREKSQKRGFSKKLKNSRKGMPEI